MKLIFFLMVKSFSGSFDITCFFKVLTPKQSVAAVGTSSSPAPADREIPDQLLPEAAVKFWMLSTRNFPHRGSWKHLCKYFL